MSTQINDHSIPTRDKWKEGERERKKKAGKKPYTQQFNPCQSTLLHVMSKLSNVFKSICNRMMVEKKNWCDYYTKITSLINRPQILQGHSFITCMEKQFKWLAFHDNGLTCCNCFFTFFFLPSSLFVSRLPLYSEMNMGKKKQFKSWGKKSNTKTHFNQLIQFFEINICSFKMFRLI